MLVRRRLPQGENRCDAGIAPGKNVFPLAARSTSKHDSQFVVQSAPASTVPGMWKLLASEPHQIEELHEESFLNRSDGHIPSVFRSVDPVKRRTTIENVRLALVVPQTERAKSVNVRGEICSTVDHGDINYLTRS